MKTKLTLNVDDKINITRNVKGFPYVFSTLTVMNPTNFLKEIYFNDIP